MLNVAFNSQHRILPKRDSHGKTHSPELVRGLLRQRTAERHRRSWTFVCAFSAAAIRLVRMYFALLKPFNQHSECSTAQSSTAQLSTMQCNEARARQRGAAQSGAARRRVDTARLGAAQLSTAWHGTVRHHAAQHRAAQHSAAQRLA